MFAAKNRAVFDVALFGSFARGNRNARDIDLAIILTKKTKIKLKLIFAQQLKEILDKHFTLHLFDVKTFDALDFLDPTFLARQSIISEGYLLVQQKPAASIFGFQSFALVSYALKNLTPSQKKMLQYALQGRRGSKGVLHELDGERFAGNILKVPTDKEAVLEDLLRAHYIQFSVEFVMSCGKRQK